MAFKILKWKILRLTRSQQSDSLEEKESIQLHVSEFFQFIQIMAEAAQNRVQTAMKNFINEIDRSRLRSREKDMHLCAANVRETTGCLNFFCSFGNQKKQKYCFQKLHIYSVFKHGTEKKVSWTSTVAQI